ncbi:MAG: translation initiation factor IF-2 [Candidatus Yanofskybacteria bacterium]|nr:translation initiation factor IF-2 [Candidatus Yanofskybacteria bacterium]
MSAETTDKKQNLQVRPPIVVVLGHVDHGKTKILDYIRKTKIAEGEAGGITQHIGAYQVESNGKMITFLDTPGHEAFSAIRSRGANVADIAILVVAADEGVKPQTKEAIKIIEDTQTPFIVAINKVDKENANVQRVKQELSENSVFIEEWGGKVPAVEVSAKTGQGIDSLLEMILLVAELEELKSDDTSTTGVIIDSHLDSRRGYVATILVKSGFFHVNDWIVTGSEAVRVKSMADFLGKSLTKVGPSQPAVVLGWATPPVLGSIVKKTESREEALKLAKDNSMLGQPVIFVQESGPEKSKNKNLNLIVKADVSSSLEAIDQVLRTIKSEEVGYKVVDYGVGNISEGDIKKAIATKAVVVGFHVPVSSSLRQMAEREGVVVESFDIIYELVEEVKRKMSDLLDPEINRITLGRLKILALFKKDTKSQVVGGKVVFGKIKRGALLDVLRSNNTISKGKLGQLQQQKADVEEVAEGLEAGLRVDFGQSISPNMYIKEGDVLEVYEEEKIKRSL